MNEGTTPAPARRRQARGLRTRERILDAALAIVAADGVAAVTHRSVAAAAGVQLSLTTYYFRDLQALLAEAFEAFAARGRPELEALWQELFRYLDGFSASQLRRGPVRREVRDVLVAAAQGYVNAQLRKRGGGLAIEQAFFHAARRDKGLRPLANRHLASLQAPITELCRRLHSDDPASDATLVLGTMMRLEYEASSGLAGRGAARRRQLLFRQVSWMLGLPPTETPDGDSQ